MPVVRNGDTLFAPGAPYRRNPSDPGVPYRRQLVVTLHMGFVGCRVESSREPASGTVTPSRIEVAYFEGMEMAWFEVPVACTE